MAKLREAAEVQNVTRVKKILKGFEANPDLDQAVTDHLSRMCANYDLKGIVGFLEGVKGKG